MNWKVFGWKRPWPNLMGSPGICIEGPSGTAEIPRIVVSSAEIRIRRLLDTNPNRFHLSQLAHVPVVNQKDPFLILPLYFCTLHFNIISQCTIRCIMS
jgi:hypothetical protein